jgi:hypothetical protein
MQSEVFGFYDAHQLGEAATRHRAGSTADSRTIATGIGGGLLLTDSKRLSAF